MKFARGLILGIVLGGAIIVGGLFLFGFFSTHKQILNANTPTISPGSIPISSPSVSTINSTFNSIPIPSSTSLTVSQVPTSDAVYFDMGVTSISGTGFSRIVTWQITNTGIIDAHNVSFSAQVYSQGKLIRVNGLDSISKTLGTIHAGETVTDEVTLSFSLLDAPEILLNGVTIDLAIVSNEKKQTMTYDYKP